MQHLIRTKQWNLTREERNLIENMLKERMEPEQSFKKISKGESVIRFLESHIL